jgi:manganese transport protein
MWSLPKTATAPFCPSEVQGSVHVSENAGFWKRLAVFAGPGLLVAVGYMDPGNWATDIEAGSKYGYSLLFVVLLSSLAAIILQCLAMKLGLVTGRDLAQLCRERYRPAVNGVLWVFAELAIIATDVAEVLGSALAFKLLLGVSLPVGIAITALDTVIILGLKGKGFRQVEAIILGLVATIGLCFLIELYLLKPYWPDVLKGFIPGRGDLSGIEPWYISIGILGATVMPHNLYLHSSIVSTRKTGPDLGSKKTALRFATLDTVGSLFLAFFVNAAIMILAASAFHSTGHTSVTEIDDAYRLLEPIVGGAFASIAFGIALLASGQSSTFTGTIAGQIVMEGYLKLKIPCWKRRVITRSLALIPAFIGVWIVGENSTGRLLVISQVVLSFQLPFAIYPLLRLTGSSQLMGEFANSSVTKVIAWFLFLVISAANIWLVTQWVTG